MRRGTAQGGQAGTDIVAVDHSDAQRHTQLRRQSGQRLRAGFGVDAACIADHLDAALDHLGKHLAHCAVNEVGGVTGVRVLALRGHQDGHGGLGQVVEHQYVDQTAVDELRRADAAVAPKSGGTSDAQRGWFGGGHHFSLVG